MRLSIYKRRLFKNEFDDLRHLYNVLGYEPQIIIDGGANIGFVTHKFRIKFPKSKIVAFEPNPGVFEKLQLAHKNDPLITCVNKGLGSSESMLTFYLNRNTGTSSFLRPTLFHQNNLSSKNITPTNIDVINLEKYLKDKSIEKIDILKLDIEGFELEALKGILEINKRVDFIFSEVNLIPTYKDQPLIDEIISYLATKGFSIYNFYGINENKDNQAIITNLLFMSNSIREKLIQTESGQSFNI